MTVILDNVSKATLTLLGRVLYEKIISARTSDYVAGYLTAREQVGPWGGYEVERAIAEKRATDHLIARGAVDP